MKEELKLKDGIWKNGIGAGISYINMIVSFIAGMIITPLLLNKLGDSEYGSYVLVASISSYLTVVKNGVSDTMIRYCTKFRAIEDKSSADRFNGLALLINVMFSIITLFIGIILVYKLHDLYGNTLSKNEIDIAVRLLKIMLLNIVITFLSNVFFGYLAAYEEFVILRGLELINLIISNVLIFCILLMGAKSFGVVVVTTCCNIAVAVAEALYSWRKLHIGFDFSINKFENDFLKEVVIYFITVFIVVIVEQIYWKLDNVLIAGYVSASTVAVYSIGMLFHKYFMKFSTTISKVMAPRFFLRIDSGADKIKLTNMLIQISKLQAVAVLLALSGLILYGREFIHLWVGKSYDIAYFIAVITLVPYSFELIGNLRNVILQAKGLYMKKSILLLMTSLLNIVLTIWWIKLFGIIGAAAATGMGIILGYIGVTVILKVCNVIDNRRYLRETYGRFIVPLLISCPTGMVIKQVIPCDSWISFICNTGLYTCIYSICIYFITFRNVGRKRMKRYFEEGWRNENKKS